MSIFGDPVLTGVSKASASGPIASFSDGAKSLPLRSLLVNIEPVQAGSGDPSPDNVRPISGWSAVNMWRTGKNLFDGSAVTATHTENWAVDWDGSADTLTITHKTNFTLGVPSFPINLPAGTYVVSYAAIVKDFSVSIYMDGEYIKILRSNTTFTIESGHVYEIQFSADQGTPNVITQLQIELGSTPTDYATYSSNQYTIQLGQTVYGGTLDVTNGVLTVDRANISSYNGETLPGEWISDRDVYAPGTTPTIGAQVVYTLATPIEYTLTPQQISSLAGENNVWADSGDVTVEYIAQSLMAIGSYVH